MSDKVREAGEYVAALKRAACGSGDKQADAYLSDMIDSVVGIVRAAALEEAERACKRQRITGPGACSVEHSRMRHDHNSGVEKCESAIRALAGRGA